MLLLRRAGAGGYPGLSSAKIFTDLTEMKKGDFFFIHVLDKKLAYRVDQVNVLEELGCDYAQGSFFNKAITIETFEVRYLKE